LSPKRPLTSFCHLQTPCDMSSTTINLGPVPKCCGGNCTCCWKVLNQSGCPGLGIDITPGAPPAIKISYVDSFYGCGGECNALQTVTLATKFEVIAPVTLTITLEGDIENQSPGYDWCDLYLDGLQILRIASSGSGGGCQMVHASDSTSVELDNGCHEILIIGSTEDEAWHQNMYHKVSFSASDPAAISPCGSTLCTNYSCSSTAGCVIDPEGNGPYQSLEECEAVCIERFECYIPPNPPPCQWNPYCASIGYAPSGQTQSECKASCFAPSWTCNSTCGCDAVLDNSGEYATRELCEQSCFARYYCDTVFGCGTSDTFGTPTGPINSGEYVTRALCEESCKERYTCETYTGCTFAQFSDTGGLLLNDCQVNCTIQSYDCDSAAGCIARYDADGAYVSDVACAAVCQDTYDCVTVYGWSYCAAVGYSTTPTTYAACCAAEPCASSPSCAQNLPMTMPPEVLKMLQMQAAPVELSSESIGLEPNATTTDIATAAAVPAAAADITTVEYVRGPAPRRSVVLPRISPTLEEQDPTGPGTFLAKTLEKIGIKSSPTCACKARARIMNEKGNDWCEKNLDTIVDWLREEATKRKLPFVNFAGNLLVKRAIKLSRAAKAKAARELDESATSSPAPDPQTGAG
jgi:hypothetical protein